MDFQALKRFSHFKYLSQKPAEPIVIETKRQIRMAAEPPSVQIRKADLWLLDEVFQRFSNWTTDQFGVNCFWCAKACLQMCAVGTLLEFLDRGSFWPTLFSLIGLALVFLAVCSSETKVRKNPRCLNANRTSYFGMRLCIMGLTVAFIPPHVADAVAGPGIIHSVASGAMGLANVAYLFAMYFQCCTPRPPKPKERRYGALQPSPI